MIKRLEKILAADDEQDIQTILQVALEDVGGYKAEFCSSGREVLDRLNAFDPDLILLDVMMPEMDGAEVLQQIRKREKFAHVPIVMITAKSQPSDVNRYRQMGAFDVICKPFDPMSLADQLNLIWKANHG